VATVIRANGWAAAADRDGACRAGIGAHAASNASHAADAAKCRSCLNVGLLRTIVSSVFGHSTHATGTLPQSDMNGPRPA
jgi:hypothetical protein